MNAQKRYIDVWLIYRCIKCDSTFNLTILSRTKPELIKRDLLLKFLENDEALAVKYAFSSETVRKKGVDFDYGSVEYEILHDNISLETVLEADDEIIKFEIVLPFGFGFKLSSVVRFCLGLSADQFNRMVEAGAIYAPEDYSLKKHKVMNGDVIMINVGKLRCIPDLIPGKEYK